jgi:WD40 repeat protein
VAVGRIGGRDVVVVGDDDGSVGSVRLWDAVSRAEIAVLDEGPGWVGPAALGRAGDREVVVAGGSDGVRLWDAMTGTDIAVLGRQGNVVRAVGLGRIGDREVVMAGGSDGVHLWDAVTGAELAVLGGQGGVLHAVLGRTDDQDVILTAAADGAVRITDIGNVTFQPGRTLIRGPGPETLLDLVPDADGGYRLSRLSGDAWRYWRAQGYVGQRLVNFPIDDMPRVG